MGEVLMDLRDHGGALAHCSGHALDRARTHIADGEHARAIGFQRQARRYAVATRGAGHDKAALVGVHAVLQPTGVGVCADEQEQVPQLHARGCTVLAGAQHRGLQAALGVAFQRGHFGAGVQLHVRQRGDTFDSDARSYVGSATLNGKPLTRAYVTHEQILAGGELRFRMRATPNQQWATDPAQRPYSMSAQVQ
ncbi:hypothetical protein XAC908_340026 [Xanthomonas citri pv. citri]|nr:hypothetical protein XAC908_340026 [Xanthomonas citri pv. citri]